MRTKIEARASERASGDIPFKSMRNLVQNQEQQNMGSISRKIETLDTHDFS